MVDDRNGENLWKTQANQMPPKFVFKKRDHDWTGKPCVDDSEIPEWLQEFREKFGGWRNSITGRASLTPTKRREDLGKHSVHTHFPKDRNCEICKRTQIARAPCRRRNGEAVPRAAKIGDLITADHKVLSEKLWISKHSSICNRGAGLGHTMDPVLSVWNKNFTGNTEKLTKVLGAR